MTVPRSRKPKPTATDEVARVLHIYDMLLSELWTREKPVAVLRSEDFGSIVPSPLPAAALATAERIAARTEG